MLNRSLPYSCAPLLQYLSAAVVCLLLLATTGNCEDDDSQNREIKGNDYWYYPINYFGHFVLNSVAPINNDPVYNINSGFGADYSPITGPVQIILHNVQYCQSVRLTTYANNKSVEQYVILEPLKGQFTSLNIVDKKGDWDGKGKTMATTIAELYPSGRHWKIAFDNHAYETYASETKHVDSSDILVHTDSSKSMNLLISASSPYCQVNVISDGSRRISERAYFHKGKDPKIPGTSEFPYVLPTPSSRNFPSIIALGDQKEYQRACPSVTEDPFFNKEDAWDVKKDKISYMYYNITQTGSVGKDMRSGLQLVVEPSECAWVRMCYVIGTTTGDPPHCPAQGNVAEFLFRNQIYFRPDDDTPYTFDVPVDALFSLSIQFYYGLDKTAYFYYPSQSDQEAVNERWTWEPSPLKTLTPATTGESMYMIVERAPNCRARLTVDDSSDLVIRNFRKSDC